MKRVDSEAEELQEKLDLRESQANKLAEELIEAKETIASLQTAGQGHAPFALASTPVSWGNALLLLFGAIMAILCLILTLMGDLMMIYGKGSVGIASLINRMAHWMVGRYAK